MARVFLSLGSNLGDSRAHLQYALDCLARDVGPVRRVSSLYRTEPQGVQDQPDYLNMVAECETVLKPEELLRCLSEIEASCGRTREHVGAPRTLDIDILLYDDVKVRSESLTLPHPRMEQRSFVLTPLAEIEPDLVLPSGTSVQELLSRPEIRSQPVERLCELSGTVHPTL